MRRMIDPKQLGGGDGKKYYIHNLYMKNYENNDELYITVTTSDKDPYTSPNQVMQLIDNYHGLPVTGTYTDRELKGKVGVTNILRRYNSASTRYNALITYSFINQDTTGKITQVRTYSSVVQNALDLSKYSVDFSDKVAEI